VNDAISISMENTKMGPTPSFSLPPVRTCNIKAPCTKHGCYAWNMYRRRKTIRTAWDRNLTIAVRKHCDDFKRQMNGWLAIYQPVAFRIHVGGDFFNQEYLQAWCDIASANKKVKFFAFTKQWDVLRPFMWRGAIPKNLSIILSGWMPSCHNWCPPEDLMRKFPVAWVVKNGCSTQLPVIYDVQAKTGKHPGVKSCEGNCASCGKCFGLKRKDGDVLFEYH